MIDCLVVDVDGTLCELMPSGSNYLTAEPRRDIIAKVNDAYYKGIHIILFTARGMKTFKGDIEAIERFHRPILETWLTQNRVFYHELKFGKPWCGKTFYLDDHALSIDHFLDMDLE